MPETLTPAQRKALTYVAEHPNVHPREVAKFLWPDSPAWNRRTRFGAVSNQGSMGGTMPMNAARILWRLQDKQLAWCDDNAWRITDKGSRALNEGKQS